MRKEEVGSRKEEGGRRKGFCLARQVVKGFFLSLFYILRYTFCVLRSATLRCRSELLDILKVKGFVENAVNTELLNFVLQEVGLRRGNDHHPGSKLHLPDLAKQL